MRAETRATIAQDLADFVLEELASTTLPDDGGDVVDMIERIAEHARSLGMLDVIESEGGTTRYLTRPAWDTFEPEGGGC